MSAASGDTALASDSSDFVIIAEYLLKYLEFDGRRTSSLARSR